MAGNDDKPSDALPPGYQLQIYRIVKVLGQGGFGITYRAEDTKHGGFVALKEFLPNQLAHRDGTTIRPNSQKTTATFESFRSKFLDEATVLLHFRHLDHIVHIQAFFQANGTAYLVMDFVAGHSLAEHLKQLGRPPTETEVKAILLPLLDDLEQVHAAGFLHRDIKPQNIVIRPDGSPVLIDFGAARQAAGYDANTKTLTSFISEGYTPPEQYYRDGEQGPWSDLYALGAVAYRMVTGGKPPSAPTRTMGRTDPYTPARQAGAGRYSDGFLAALDWALERYAESRPQTAAAWRAAFDRSPADTGRHEPPAPGRSPGQIPDPDPLTLDRGADGTREGPTSGTARTATRLETTRADDRPTAAPGGLPGGSVPIPASKPRRTALAAALGAGIAVMAVSAMLVWSPWTTDQHEPPPVQPAPGPAPGPVRPPSNVQPPPPPETPAALPQPPVASPPAAPAKPALPLRDPVPSEQPRLDALAKASKLPTTMIQWALKGTGHYAGAIDGQSGAGTARAIADFQKSINAANSGVLTPEQTVLLIRRAAESGQPESEVSLGVLFATGVGMVKDDAAAVIWFRRAAEQNNRDGAYNLGRMVRDGRGLDANRDEALRLFRQAQQLGHPDAARAILEMPR